LLYGDELSEFKLKYIVYLFIKRN